MPLTDKMAVLPLIGDIDINRTKIIRENTLMKVNLNRYKELIIDFSGVNYIDNVVLEHILKLIDGLKLLGCKTTFSGIRPDLASSMVNVGSLIWDKVDIKATLKHALEGKIK